MHSAKKQKFTDMRSFKKNKKKKIALVCLEIRLIKFIVYYNNKTLHHVSCNKNIKFRRKINLIDPIIKRCK